MPGGTDVGWTKLSPAMQQRVGHSYYLRYWGEMTSFSVVTPPHQTGSNTVEVVLEFTQNGKHYRELHRLGMITSNGQVLIDSDALASSG